METIRKTLRKQVRNSFIRNRLHRVAGGFNDTALEFTYLSRFSQWCDDMRLCPLNDYPNPKPDHNKRFDLYQNLVDMDNLRNQQIDYLEFGVFKGASINWWLKTNTNPKSRFIGFD